jgi:hypothetical protein
MTPPDNHTHDFTSHPFEVTGHWHEAAPLLERFTKERLGRYRFDPSIERRQPQFLERLTPPE